MYTSFTMLECEIAMQCPLCFATNGGDRLNELLVSNVIFSANDWLTSSIFKKHTNAGSAIGCIQTSLAFINPIFTSILLKIFISLYVNGT